MWDSCGTCIGEMVVSRWFVLAYRCNFLKRFIISGIRSSKLPRDQLSENAERKCFSHVIKVCLHYT